MKRIGNRTVGIGIVVVAAALGSGWTSIRFRDVQRTGQSVLRVEVSVDKSKPKALQMLADQMDRAGFDVAGLNYETGALEVVTSREGLKRIQNNGLRAQVLTEYTAGDRSEKNAPDKRFFNPESLEKKLRALHTQFPQITRLESIGTTHQGRPVLALLISATPGSTGANDPKMFERPTIMFDGMHHAREIMTPEIVADVADSVLQGFSPANRSARNRSFQTSRWILQNWNIWLVPMLNPDGNNIVWTSDAMWRKNAKSAGNNKVYGVDLNRNYAFNWNKCGGSSGSTGSDTYRGDRGLSEPETQAIIKLADSVYPAISLSYHSYSELILYPYGCRGELTGENALIDKVSKELADLLPRDSGSGNYTPGAPWKILYGVDGDSMSHIFGTHGALAYTFEVNTSFQPSYDLRQPTVLKHRKAWQHLMARGSNNMLALRVVDGKTKKPAQANLAIAQIQHKLNERPFRTNPAGIFFKILDPGSYKIDVVLADGRKASGEVQMNGQPKSVEVVVQ